MSSFLKYKMVIDIQFFIDKFVFRDTEIEDKHIVGTPDGTWPLQPIDTCKSIPNS